MLDALVSGLITGNTYALIAIGISLIFGVADLVNFAHGSVFAVGAMIGWFLAGVLHWPLSATIVAVIILTAGIGLFIERVCVRPLAGAPPIAPLLSTVALSLILDFGSQLIFAPDTKHFPTLLPTNNFRIGGMRFGTLDLTILAVCIVSVVALWLFLTHARLGWAIRATAQDRDAAQQMGVDVGSVQGLSFAIASALAGVGGVLVGMYYGNVDPTIGFNAGLEGFAAATLGGLGSLPGAVVGGLILGVAESFGVTLLGGTSRQLIAFGIMVGVLWLRPNGLFGSTRVLLREPLTGTFFGLGKPLQTRPWHVLVAGAVAVFVLPLVGSDYVLRVGSIVAIFATLALSLTVLGGTAGQVSLGQAGLFAIGAYTSALLTTTQGWSFFAALPAAGLVAAVIGAIIVAPALSLRGHYVAITTLGVGVMLVSALLNFDVLTRGPMGITNIPSPVLFGYSIDSPRDFYLLSLGVLALCGALVLALQRSHVGRAWRGIREDPVAAESFGVGLAGYKSLAFAVGAFISGLAGSLLAHEYGFISPDVFDVPTSILAFTIVVMGGMSSVFGAVIGTVVLVGGPELFRPLHDVRIVAYGLLLLLLVRFRPQGLMGNQ